MTVATEVARSGPYAGAGTIGPFTVGFRFLADSHLQVVRTSTAGIDTTLTLTTHYSVAGAGATTGTVTLVTALAVGEKLTIIRKVPFTQEADYVPGDSFPAESHEQALDKLTMETQQLKETVSRSITAAISSPAGIDYTLPAPEAFKILGWNGTATGFQNTDPSGAGALAADLANNSDSNKGAKLVGYDGATAQAVLDDAKVMANYTALRAYTGRAIGVRFTTQGIAGHFYRDTADLTSLDNGGTIIVDAAARRWKRLFNGNVLARWFGAVGNGVADDTAALQACYSAHPGKYIDHEAGFTYLISAGLVGASGTTYAGTSKIKAKNGANIAAALFTTTNAVSCVIEGLEFDGNVDLGGSTSYLIYHTGGTGNRIRNTYLHDSKNAGIRDDTADGSIITGNRVILCGRTGVTDNHGIMFGSSTGVYKNGLISENFVDRAFRKGIATYGFAPGVVRDSRIVDNEVISCPLGGIYVAGDVGTIVNCFGITIEGNTLTDSYANLEIANCSKITVGPNDYRMVTPAGLFANLAIAGAHEVNVTGGINAGAAVHGIAINDANGINCINVNVKGMTILNPNQTMAGTGCGVQILNSSFCSIDVVVGDGTARMTHGILEAGTSNNNSLGGYIRNGTAAVITRAGAATHTHNVANGFQGIGQLVPFNTLHIEGGISINPQLVTFVNGANQNFVLPARAGTLISASPTANYSIGGLAGAHNGMRLTLMNYTSFTMTLNHQDAGSTAANRFTLPNSAALVVPSFGSIELFYSTIVGAWAAH